MSSWEVTTTQARPPQAVPRFSVMVWRLSIRWVSWPMNWPISSTRKTRRWAGPRLSRYSRTQPVKFSTVSSAAKSASALSSQPRAPSGLLPKASASACTISSR